MNDPEITVGIFSHSRPIAKGFLRQIKREFEQNETLKALFPEIVWDNPDRDAPNWSEDSGLVVNRKTNPKEATVEAHGLVDAQPTGKHFSLLVYDDVVTRTSVYTSDMMKKTDEAFEHSLNLGAMGGRRRFIGTRYHFNDTYKMLIDRDIAKPRIHTATHDNTSTGTPVLLSQEQLEDKKKQGPYTFSSQFLQNPIADEKQAFKHEWLRWYEDCGSGDDMNRYIVVDPANEKKKSSDWTAMWVIGLGQDNNYYILDMVRDRLNLIERALILFKLHKKWRPRSVGYEKYGMQADIMHIKECMERDNYRFNIIELGGQMPKLDRIKKLMPLFQESRVWLPELLWYTNYEGKREDLVNTFIQDEYKAFPVGTYDMLDSLARILDKDLGAAWPLTEESEDRYRTKKVRASGWAR